MKQAHIFAFVIYDKNVAVYRVSFINKSKLYWIVRVLWTGIRL